MRIRLTAQAQQLGADLLAPWAGRIDAAAARLTPQGGGVGARFLAEVLDGDA